MPLYPAPAEGSIIPLIGGLISRAAPFVSGLISRFLPQATRAVAPVGRAIVPVARQLVRTPVGRALTIGGAIGAGQELVQRGFKITIDRRTGQQRMVRRRRLNPGNVRAARRAIRRLRAFKRVTAKVNRLLTPRKVFLGHRHRRRQRGDILPFEHDRSINPYAAEDWADYVDEMEDLGFDPESFFQDEAEVGG